MRIPKWMGAAWLATSLVGCSCQGASTRTDAATDAYADDVTLVASIYGYCTEPSYEGLGVRVVCADAPCTATGLAIAGAPLFQCTVPCESDADCPSSDGTPGACVQRSGTARLCVLTCTLGGSPGQCPSSQACERGADGGGYCL